MTEQSRLRTLHQYKILDTPAEPEYDEIVQIACHLLQVPMAVISFVDRDRVWFKARRGLPVHQLERANCLCSRAILSDHAVIIRDAQVESDPACEQMRTLGLRFGAAVPIRVDKGFRLGALAVADRVLRPDIATLQIEILTTLASLVVRKLEEGSSVRA